MEAGIVKIAGTDKNTIVALAEELIIDQNLYNAMANSANPYGDGHASERIVSIILKEFGQNIGG